MPTENLTLNSSPESWRPIAGMDYEVSDMGRVRHVPSGRIRKHDHYECYARVRFKIYYPYVHTFCPFVHTLVLEAFVGPRPAGFVTRHLNGNKRDNRLENLVWGSHKENARDRTAHGQAAHGARNGAAKLTYADVENIRQATGSYGFQARLARDYGVSETTISRIRLGKTWGPRRVRVHFPKAV